MATRLADECRLRGRPLAAHRLHVTLHPFGEFAGLPAALIAQARFAAARVADGSAFDVVFDRVESFERAPGREMPLVLLGDRGLDALLAFHVRLGAALVDAGLAAFVQRQFRPHMTLMYDRTRLCARPIEPLRVAATGFKLIHSLRGRTMHRVLDSWSFGAARTESSGLLS
jgi:2'-5' RNA ligase